MTPLQIRALDFTRDRISEMGYAPTIGEIADYIGVPQSSAQSVIDALVRDKALERVANRPRGLRLSSSIDLRHAATTAMRLELARRGVTFESLAPARSLAVGHAVRCASHYCGETVQRGHLMCKRHWFTLPRELRDGLYRACIVDRDEIAFEQLLTRAHDIIERRDAA